VTFEGIIVGMLKRFSLKRLNRQSLGVRKRLCVPRQLTIWPAGEAASIYCFTFSAMSI